MEFKGNWIQGEFARPARPQGEWIVRSPSDETDELGAIQYSYAAIDEAVGAARLAQTSWSRTEPQQRRSMLQALGVALGESAGLFVELMGREIGKARWEAEAEVADAIAAIGAAIEASEQAQAAPNLEVRERPLGVAAVVGPFNSPLYYSLSAMAAALVSGNSVIFKPSEKTPFVSQLLFECFSRAGFPRGVVQLVQGERETGRRLCAHEGVDLVLFTGSYDVGVRIKQDTLQQHWKRIVLETGGKNTLIVCADADLGSAVEAAVVGAFATAGQRCTASSRILIHEAVIDDFTRRFHERSKAFTIGHPSQGVFMGPLIDRGSVDRYMKYLGIAVREGAELIMRGKALELSHKGCYVAPSIVRFSDGSAEAARRSIFQQSEIFAPCVALMPFEDLGRALASADATQFGRVTSIYSADRDSFEQAVDTLQCGAVHWNRPTTDINPRLPSLGRKKSGNHFAMGASRLDLCTAPVVCLER